MAALQALDEAEKAEPSFIYADYYRALYLDRLERSNEAKRARARLLERADRILRVAPRHQYALFVKAYCLLSEDEITESERVLRLIGQRQIDGVMRDFFAFPTLSISTGPVWQEFAEAYRRVYKLGTPTTAPPE
jgi:hypothetical protein